MLVDFKSYLITDSQSAFIRTREMYKLKSETSERNPTETQNEKTAIRDTDNVGRNMTPLCTHPLPNCRSRPLLLPYRALKSPRPSTRT